jgi:hypothetical protein
MNHSCFPTILPDLPYGYQLVANRLSPLPGFDLPDIAICNNCYYNAAITYDINDMNTLSAWMAVSDEDWAMLRGHDNAFPLVNANAHVMFDVLYPPHVRERRTCTMISRYDRVWPKGAGGFLKLTYRVHYTVPGVVGPQGPVYLDEKTVKAYPGGVDALNRFWYENDKHNIELAFLRGLLAQDPSANQCLWAKLPLAEGLCILQMYNAGRLGEWAAGMTLRKYLTAGSPLQCARGDVRGLTFEQLWSMANTLPSLPFFTCSALSTMRRMKRKSRRNGNGIGTWNWKL